MPSIIWCGMDKSGTVSWLLGSYCSATPKQRGGKTEIAVLLAGCSKRLSSVAAASEGTRRTLWGMLRVRATREQSSVKDASRRIGVGWVRKMAFSASCWSDRAGDGVVTAQIGNSRFGTAEAAGRILRAAD